MDSVREQTTDWVNLPEGVSTVNLWDTLHDGDLVAIDSDLLARTVTMRFDVGYVRQFHQLPAETLFVVKVRGVQSVRSVRSVPWPGEFSLPTGLSRQEESKLIDDYHQKWREESQEWSDFERLTSEGLEVADATLAHTSNSVALRLGLSVGNDSYVEAFIRGDNIEFYVGQKPMTPEQFVSLGEAYWSAFAERKSRL